MVPPVGTRSLTRRELVAAGGAAAVAAGGWAAVPGWARKRPAPLAAAGSFAQGVASGLPQRHGATLWTRLADVQGSARVELEVARDPAFARVLERRRVIASPADDHCVHAAVAAKRLQPGRTYYYRFSTATSDSPVGRFRTLPAAGSTDPLRIGFWTCQHFTAGYYAPHAALAAEPDLDLVVCLGDYIYEYGGRSALEGRDDLTGSNGDGNASTLSDYRAKYRLYRGDQRLRDLHAAHAMVAVWDDHEVANDYWRDGQSGTASEGFAGRRAAAYRAWFEHLPTRRMFPGTAKANQIFRGLHIGGLADLFMIDGRQYRDAQPCNDVPLSPCPDRNKPRTLLGARQKRWLQDSMRASRAPWKVLVNDVMMAGLDTPVPGSSKFLDTWDGYGAERAELVGSWRRAGVDNVVVMTGDDHDNYAGTVTTTGHTDGEPGAVEFVVPSVTSDNTSELIGGSAAGAAAAEENARALNPHLAYVEQRHHGYCVLELTATEARADFRHVSARDDPNAVVATARSFRVPRGQIALEPLAS
jgi:alkaline phosphatase D